MATSSNTAIVPASNINNATTTQTHHTFAIKLNFHNYLAWKTKFLPLLNYQNLTGFVDGTTPAPSKEILDPNNSNQTIPNPDFINWFAKDQMLMTWLLSSLTEEVYSYVIGLTSSLQVWNALAHAFGSVS